MREKILDKIRTYEHERSKYEDLRRNSYDFEDKNYFSALEVGCERVILVLNELLSDLDSQVKT